MRTLKEVFIFSASEGKYRFWTKLVQNFSLELQFWIFGQNVPKKGISGQK